MTLTVLKRQYFTFSVITVTPKRLGPKQLCTKKCVSEERATGTAFLLTMTPAVIEDDDSYAPSVREYPRYTLPMAAPKPFLVPSFDDEVVEILPSEKQNRKIRFTEQVQVMEIENRITLMYLDEEEDEDSYEIEIVDDEEGGEDADFYLEIVDGEIYYVFETEDDISVENMEEEIVESESETESSYDRPVKPLQLPIDLMSTPNLDSDTCTPTQMDYYEVSESSNEESEQLNESLSNLIYEDKSIPKEEEKVGPAYLKQVANEASSEAKSQIQADEGESSHQESESEEEETKVDIMTEKSFSCESPLATYRSPSSPLPRAGKSILKACPPSPHKEEPKKDISKKKAKTFTKTYVRAEDFDGEHTVYTWKKPEWTNATLKSTDKGESLKSGGNLANPITFPKKYSWNHKLDGEQVDEEVEHTGLNKEEIIKKICSGQLAIPMPMLPGKTKSQRKLKFSLAGAKIRDGGDIVKPITKATEFKTYGFQKPEWTRSTLHATKHGQKVKSGEAITEPITKIAETKKYAFEKPSWVKQRSLRSVDSDLDNSAHSRSSRSSDKKEYKWEQPGWAKDRQRRLSFDGGLESNAADTRDNNVRITKKKYEWEKPCWAKKETVETPSDPNNSTLPLKPTRKGRRIRDGASLAKPITSLPEMVKKDGSVKNQ